MGISFVKNCGIIKLSVKKANCIDNTGVKGCNAMKEITKETLLKAMKSRDAGEHPVDDPEQQDVGEDHQEP